MSTDVQLILDEMSNSISYGGGQWSVHTDIRWFGGTCMWPQFADGSSGATGVFGTLDLSFQGTAISFFGNTPPLPQSQNVTVTIDSNISYNSTYPDPHDYIQWYQTPVLADGLHNISMRGIAGTALDFAVITLGANTTLSGNPKIIVDDDSPEIRYTGNWKRSGDPFITSEGPNGRPFHNGTHQSSTPGDTATFRFAGTSIGVYGVFSWVNTGSLGVTYTLDGISTASTYPVTPTTPEYVNKLRQHPNYMFFSNDSLPAGNHSLVIKITQASGLTFSMDYITYRPSFPSVDLKPNLTNTSSTSKSSGKSAPSVGGIIGAIIGALVLLSSVVALLFVLQRRRRQQELEESTKIVPWHPSNRPDSESTTQPLLAMDLMEPVDGSRPPPGNSRLTPEHASPVPAPQRKRRAERVSGAPAVPGPSRKYRLEWANANPAPSGETSLPQLIPPPPGAAPAPQPVPSLRPSLSPESRPSSGTTLLTPRQREIQRRMQELTALMATQNSPQGDGATGEAAIQIAELRARVDELVRENAILGGAPPPAYESAP